MKEAAPLPAAPATPGPAKGAFSARRRLPLRALLLVLGGTLAVALLLGWAGGYSYRDLRETAPPGPLSIPSRKERREIGRLERRIAAQAPAGVHIVVDTLGNRLALKKGDRVLREAVCSTGTGGVLEDPATGRRWVFDTPRGVHQVLAKKKDPVWNKPDWAFVEEGLPIPKDPRERMDDYSLGDYALSLGDGYLIHGTLYQRLLGRSVTHGCVRLGDADLEAVYQATPMGAWVFIY
ncbi:MAG TPA: L,D-transpeptidase [Thermoanaerobaculia bacterium]|nr:L,D-transpeptidase [Thermoanaerobaculia bacterium]